MIFLFAFLGICTIQLILVLVDFKLTFILKPGGHDLLAIYLNQRIDENLYIYFGYTLMDVMRWGLTRTDGRVEFQILLTFMDNKQINVKEINDASVS